MEALEALAGDVPSCELPREEVVGAPLPKVMAAAGLCASQSAARRLIKGGGCRLNNQKVEEEMYAVKEEDLVGGKMMLVQSGKKNKVICRIV